LGSKTTCDAIGQGYRITLSDRFQRNTVPDLLAAKAPINKLEKYFSRMEKYFPFGKNILDLGDFE
jgi:hypothetical protein